MALVDDVARLLAEGRGEERAGVRFLPLVALESEARIGIDAALRWLNVPADERPPFVCAAGSEHVLAEALEWKRDAFDTALEDAARAHGLAPDDVVFAFPIIEVVRAVLASRSPYLSRLALLWLRPTELRALRAEIMRVAADPELPAPLKDLAERLVVPE